MDAMTEEGPPMSVVPVSMAALELEMELGPEELALAERETELPFTLRPREGGGRESVPGRCG